MQWCRGRRFQAVADSRAEARVAGKQDFGLSDTTAEGRQQIAGIVAAWELARDVIAKESETRAEAKVLGQPRILQVTERQAMLKAVFAVHGQLGKSETPSAEYLAIKCEECEANEPQAATLDSISSKKTALATSVQSTLDAAGRIHITQQKTRSELPTTTEGYRKLMRVEAFAWLCVSSRFRSKAWLQGLNLCELHIGGESGTADRAYHPSSGCACHHSAVGNRLGIRASPSEGSLSHG